MKGAAGALLLALAACAAPPPTAPLRRPSIVLLLTDDQRADALGCAGHPVLKTPNIDRLAHEGVRFRNAFVTTSICAVSRASVLTGRLCRNHRVGDFATPLPPEVLAASFPALLKGAGYRTGCFGKWGIGGRAPRELFDAWDAWGGQGDYFLSWEGERVHNSEYLARRAEEFLKATPAETPFCLLVYYKSPHDPYGQPDPRDADLFNGQEVPVPRTATPAHFAALPKFIQDSEGRRRALRFYPAPDRLPGHIRDYLRLVAGVDRSVGKILDLLERLNRARDTVVVYSSDNGFFLGERGLSHKWLMHEESIRVPLLVRAPGLAGGRTREEMALNIDIAPTLLDLAGLPAPGVMDGRSLRPLLEGRPAAWRGDFFYEHHFSAPSAPIPRTEGVRTAGWKYITYFDVTPPFEELYDLESDPYEERNLAADPAHRGRLEEMKSLYGSHVRRLPVPVLPSAPRR
jgi:arylsulfatase A-like enzyme